MSKITTQQRCVVMRNGSEIWLPKEKVDQLEAACIAGTAPRWVKFTDAAGRTENTADMTEFLNPDQVEDRHRQKLGEWKCQYGRWHGRKDKCDCRAIIAQERYEAETKARIDAASKPFTPEQIEANRIKLAEMKKGLFDILKRPEPKKQDDLRAVEASAVASRAAQTPPADPPEPLTEPPAAPEEKNAAQLQIEADAREFEKKYGIDDDIDVRNIPF